VNGLNDDDLNEIMIV